MIKISLDSQSIKAQGHALFSKAGSDVVCAGVSSIIMGSIPFFSSHNTSIKIDVKIPAISFLIDTESEFAKVGMKLLTEQLKSISNAYPRKVKLNYENETI